MRDCSQTGQTASVPATRTEGFFVNPMTGEVICCSHAGEDETDAVVDWRVAEPGVSNRLTEALARLGRGLIRRAGAN